MAKKEKGDEKDDFSWFGEIHPNAKEEFPPILTPKVGKPYRIKFTEDKPRVVQDKFDKTGVIEVEYEGKPRSLFLGHTFLAQKIYELQKEHGKLTDIEIVMTQFKKVKDYIEYEIKEIK